MEETQVTLARDTITLLEAIHRQYGIQWSVIAALMDVGPDTLYQLRQGRIPSVAMSRDYHRRLNKVLQIVAGCEQFLKENRVRNRSGHLTLECFANYLHYIFVIATADDMAEAEEAMGARHQAMVDRAAHAGQVAAAKKKIDGNPISDERVSETTEERAIRIRKLAEARVAAKAGNVRKKVRPTQGPILT